MTAEHESQPQIEVEAPIGHDIWIFPGQGGLVVGIGKKEYDESERAKEIFRKADTLVGGAGITSLCFDGPIDELSRSENAHVALVTVATSKLVAGIENGRFQSRPRYVIGCSAGLIPAMVAGGVVPFEVGVRIAQERGRLTQEASDGLDASMETIIVLNSEAGRAEELAYQACREESEAQKGVIAVSGIYSPTSIGITGDNLLMEGVNRRLKPVAKRIVPQAGITIVSHSPYMKPASEKLSEFLKDIEFDDPWYTFVMNGEIVKYGADIKSRLAQELLDPVRLTATTRKIMQEGGATNVREFTNGVDDKPRWARFVAETVGHEIPDFSHAVI